MTLTLPALLVLIVIAAICGAVGKSLAGGGPGGLVASIALGFIGALLGMWIAGRIGLPELFALDIGGEHFPIIWSIIGSTIFVAVISLFTRRYVV